MEQNKIMNERLLEVARRARTLSYSPYSGITVGAALITEAGKVFVGANIENAAFSPTVCAERVAFFRAISEGERKFKKIAIAGGKTEKVPRKNSLPAVFADRLWQNSATAILKSSLTAARVP